MIIQSKQVFKWVSISWHCWYLIPERDDAENPVLFNQIANVGLCTETGKYDYFVHDPDNCYTVIAKGVCDSIEHGKRLVEQVLRKCGYVYSA